MLLDSKEFIQTAINAGCTKEDFEGCAQRITERSQTIDQVYSHGQQLYFTYYPFPILQLQVVISPRDHVIQQERPYAELFDVIKQLSH